MLNNRYIVCRAPAFSYQALAVDIVVEEVHGMIDGLLLANYCGP